MGKTEITIEIDDELLASYNDRRLALCWHAAQANSAPYGDHRAGELVERIGREIIGRWLRTAPVELWKHQGRNNPHKHLADLATYKPGGPSGTPEFHNGEWVPNALPAIPDTIVPDVEDATHD